MKSDFRWLRLQQLDARLERWRAAARDNPVPSEGWLRTVRKTLELGTAQFARRLGTRQPWVVQLEKGEVKGTVTLASMRKAADALDCDLVYALVPRKPLVDTLHEQATRIARRELEAVGHSM